MMNSTLDMNFSNFNVTEPDMNLFSVDSYPIELLISNLTISAIIIVLNSIFIITAIFRRQILRPPSSWMLLSLAICDVMRGVGIPLVLASELIQSFKIPNTSVAMTYRVAVDVFNAFTIKASVVHLCGITWDRHIALSKTYSYKSIVTMSRVVQFLRFCWLFAFVASSIQFTWLYPIMSDSMNGSIVLTKIDIWYSVVSFFIFLALPTIILGTIFVSIFLRIRKIMSKIVESTQINFNKASQKQLRILYSFFVMYLCFAVLVMPYFSLRLYIDIKSWHSEDVIIHPSVYHVVYLCKNVTSIFNPLLYIRRCQKFRKESKNLFCSCFVTLFNQIQNRRKKGQENVEMTAL